jgi:ADP-heptose:LPS heptosyltransferase
VPVLEHNPYILERPEPGCEWLIDYTGHRPYITHEDSDRWHWNYDYRAEPAEIFWGPDEHVEPGNYVVIEPHIKGGASPAKQWKHYQAVVDGLPEIEFRQPSYGRHILRGVRPVGTNLRQAALLLAGARAVLLPDGFLQHLAAAVGTPGVVIFGGFAPKEVLGYPIHTNLGDGAYGQRKGGRDSATAMEAIRPEQVIRALKEIYDSRGDRLRL